MNAKVHIRVAQRAGIPYLREAYFTPPWKVADITEGRDNRDLQLMLMCSSPGILDEDIYEMKLELEEECRLQLFTQSYQRIFQMEQGASQSMEVRIGKGASFCYLPHPCVPHADSKYTGRNRIWLSEGSRLIWGEVLTCGRKLNGEIFRFSRYQVLTEVFRMDKLVIRENICLRLAPVAVSISPVLPFPDMQAIGQLEGFTHQASLICLQENAPEAIREAITSRLLEDRDILSGVSAAPVSGWIVRILGNRAEQLHTCLKDLAVIINAGSPTTAKSSTVPGSP